MERQEIQESNCSTVRVRKIMSRFRDTDPLIKEYFQKIELKAQEANREKEERRKRWYCMVKEREEIEKIKHSIIYGRGIRRKEVPSDIDIERLLNQKAEAEIYTGKECEKKVEKEKQEVIGQKEEVEIISKEVYDKVEEVGIISESVDEVEGSSGEEGYKEVTEEGSHVVIGVEECLKEATPNENSEGNVKEDVKSDEEFQNKEVKLDGSRISEVKGNVASTEQKGRSRVETSELVETVRDLVNQINNNFDSFFNQMTEFNNNLETLSNQMTESKKDFETFSFNMEAKFNQINNKFETLIQDAKQTNKNLESSFKQTNNNLETYSRERKQIIDNGVARLDSMLDSIHPDGTETIQPTQTDVTVSNENYSNQVDTQNSSVGTMVEAITYKCEVNEEIENGTNEVDGIVLTKNTEISSYEINLGKEIINYKFSKSIERVESETYSHNYKFQTLETTFTGWLIKKVQYYGQISNHYQIISFLRKKKEKKFYTKFKGVIYSWNLVDNLSGKGVSIWLETHIEHLTQVVHSKEYFWQLYTSFPVPKDYKQWGMERKYLKEGQLEPD